MFRFISGFLARFLWFHWNLLAIKSKCLPVGNDSKTLRNFQAHDVISFQWHTLCILQHEFIIILVILRSKISHPFVLSFRLVL